MRNRSDALVIKLASDEKRDDIDFTVPPHDVLVQVTTVGLKVQLGTQAPTQLLK